MNISIPFLKNNLLEIFSKKAFNSEKVFNTKDSCFSKDLAWIMVCYATNQNLVKKTSKLEASALNQA